ncbi:hypothetical protein HDV05_006602 [Chytridiales sp. JEL 0842]|nr:hypothetical protein HDV05_006602 [Chytridiales sp. JEL 0842]
MFAMLGFGNAGSAEPGSQEHLESTQTSTALPSRTVSLAARLSLNTLPSRMSSITHPSSTPQIEISQAEPTKPAPNSPIPPRSSSSSKKQQQQRPLKLKFPKPPPKLLVPSYGFNQVVRNSSNLDEELDIYDTVIDQKSLFGYISDSSELSANLSAFPNSPLSTPVGAQSSPLKISTSLLSSPKAYQSSPLKTKPYENADHEKPTRDVSPPAADHELTAMTTASSPVSRSPSVLSVEADEEEQDVPTASDLESVKLTTDQQKKESTPKSASEGFNLTEARARLAKLRERRLERMNSTASSSQDSTAKAERGRSRAPAVPKIETNPAELQKISSSMVESPTEAVESVETVLVKSEVESLVQGCSSSTGDMLKSILDRRNTLKSQPFKPITESSAVPAEPTTTTATTEPVVIDLKKAQLQEKINSMIEAARAKRTETLDKISSSSSSSLRRSASLPPRIRTTAMEPTDTWLSAGPKRRRATTLPSRFPNSASCIDLAALRRLGRPMVPARVRPFDYSAV